MHRPAIRFYEFGPFSLDTADFRLFRDGVEVPLPNKVLETLLVLLEKPGQLVSKDKLMERVWPGTFVGDDSLAQNISLLRKAIDYGNASTSYIATVPKLGYRFVGIVNSQELEGAGVQPLNAVQNVTSGIDIPALAKSRNRWMLAGIALILTISAIVALRQWARHAGNGHPAPNGFIVAVLPFENLTGNPGQDYLSDGMTEEMITQLGRIDPQRIRVIARTSVMQFKHDQQPLDRVGAILGVQYVLEGSVRRDGDNVRVTAQLIQVKDQTHIWAREYDRHLNNLLTLQAQIAQETAAEIQRALGVGSRNKTNNSQSPATLTPQEYKSYDLYLKGRYFWNKRTPEGFQQAIDAFQQALVENPDDARVYAGLADTYALMGSYTFAPPDEMIPRARAAALQALRLDENLSEAHASLALITELYDWDWPAADKEFRRAIELDPNYATGHHWYAEFLAFWGHFDEALNEIERARQLDPLSKVVATDKGAILYFARQYDGAIEQLRAVLDLDPGMSRAHLLCFAYAEKGQFTEALAHIDVWRRRHQDGPWPTAAEAYVYGRAGQKMRAERALAKLKEETRHSNLDPVPMFALAYAGMKQNDEALFWLQKGYAEHTSALIAIKVDPIYDSLRTDPRFQDLLRRVNLVP
jgi:TolB-like protein/DNA-binding winged helix-turn-helix (wHTH) protein/Flp pilus assembly protein TadD